MASAKQIVCDSEQINISRSLLDSQVGHQLLGVVMPNPKTVWAVRPGIRISLALGFPGLPVAPLVPATLLHREPFVTGRSLACTHILHRRGDCSLLCTTMQEELGALVFQMGRVGPLSKPLALARRVVSPALVLVVHVCHALQLLISLQDEEAESS